MPRISLPKKDHFYMSQDPSPYAEFASQYKLDHWHTPFGRGYRPQRKPCKNCGQVPYYLMQFGFQHPNELDHFNEWARPGCHHSCVATGNPYGTYEQLKFSQWVRSVGLEYECHERETMKSIYFPGGAYFVTVGLPGWKIPLLQKEKAA